MFYPHSPLSKFPVYSKTQYQNIPRDATLNYYYPYLGYNIPQTQYPYDSVYDNEYQSLISHPKYRHFGNLEYPYYVRRHRTPKIYTRPKPNEYKFNNYTYQIPNYPPYVYWYPRPGLCRDSCGDAVCNEYFKRINDWRNCRRCQNMRPNPMCWDSVKEKCVPCPRNEALGNCNLRSKFGCANPNGPQHSDVPPINPLYTGCSLCN
jgi:hypothetical protein